MTGRATAQEKILRAYGKRRYMTLEDLCKKLHTNNRNLVSQACSRLVRRGLLVRQERGLYKLQGTGKEELTCGPKGCLTQVIKVPRAKPFYERVWKVLRMRDKVSTEEITSFVCDDTVKDAHNVVVRYTRLLHRSGYLRRLHRIKGQGSSLGHIRYRLLRNTGSKAPIWSHKFGKIYDRNLGKWSDEL